jgi:hypothetical protein
LHLPKPGTHGGRQTIDLLFQAKPPAALPPQAAPLTDPTKTIINTELTPIHALNVNAAALVATGRGAGRLWFRTIVDVIGATQRPAATAFGRMRGMMNAMIGAMMRMTIMPERRHTPDTRCSCRGQQQHPDNRPPRFLPGCRQNPTRTLAIRFLLIFEITCDLCQLFQRNLENLHHPTSAVVWKNRCLRFLERRTILSVAPTW